MDKLTDRQKNRQTKQQTDNGRQRYTDITTDKPIKWQNNRQIKQLTNISIDRKKTDRYTDREIDG
jgi:hypothetical protein